MLVLTAFAAFVSIGLPDGILGVAWPSIRRTFDLPLSQLGALLAAAMAGYLVSSFSSGWVVARVGVGRLLLGSSALTVMSSIGYAVAPAWGVMLISGVLAGLGAGAIDAGINAFAAARFPPRLVSWLHASYGLGAMLGPLLMTGVLAASLPWRWGYAVVGAILTGMALCFALTLDLWHVRRPASAGAQRGASSASVLATLARPPVWLNVGLFFVYTGLEVTAGQWTYSLLTEGRGVAAGPAGIWVGIYWGSLMVGRLVCGALTNRLSTLTLLRVATIGGPLAALMIWSDQSRGLSFLGLALLGFLLAPIFPLLIADTPRRLGAAHATQAIGFQVSAAYLGAAAIPGAAGILARWAGIGIVGAFLVAVAVALLVLHEIALRGLARPRRREEADCTPVRPATRPNPSPID